MLVPCSKTHANQHNFVRTILVSSTRQSLKAIEIQLTLEGCHFGELEINGQEFLEFLGLSYDKATTVRLPRNDITMTIGFHFVQHFVKANRKGRGNTTTSGTFVDQIVFIGVIVVVMFHDNVRMTGRMFTALVLCGWLCSGGGGSRCRDNGVGARRQGSCQIMQANGTRVHGCL